jgi:hypothetical protein
MINWNKDFYPTPPEIIEKMLDGIKIDDIKNLLEPSAGKGDILDFIKKYEQIINETPEIYKYRYSRKFDGNIDCIEIDANLQYILKGKNYNMIFDDFLKFETYKIYDCILMNPPFRYGAEHLLKAIELMKNGGIIRCLLNAETLLNPFCNSRKDLNTKLKDLEAEIEYIDDAFIDAEKKTAVKIALIKIEIKETEKEKSFIFEKLQKKYYAESVEYIKEDNQIQQADYIKSIVARYNFECRLGIDLIKEFKATNTLLNKYFKNHNQDNYFNLMFTGDDNKYREKTIFQNINDFVKMVRNKYWRLMFQSNKFTEIMTSYVREEYYKKIDTLENYDFNEYNINVIYRELESQYKNNVEKAILKLFDDFSHEYHWSEESSKNIHYYNGWKTNKAWKINKKVILPHVYAWGDYSWEKDFEPTNYKIIEKFADIEKCFNLLAGVPRHDIYIRGFLERAKNEGKTKNIRLKYFNLTFFKKGTCHIVFSDLKLLDKFNIFGSQHKNWLPPGFGKTDYSNMSKEEKEVVNEFCGEAKYKEFQTEKNYYLVNKLLLLS